MACRKIGQDSRHIAHHANRMRKLRYALCQESNLAIRRAARIVGVYNASSVIIGGGVDSSRESSTSAMAAVQRRRAFDSWYSHACDDCDGCDCDKTYLLCNMRLVIPPTPDKYTSTYEYF